MAVPGEVFEEVAPDDPRAIALFRAHTSAGAAALGLPDPEPATASPTLAPPTGALLLVTVDGEPVAIGGIRDLDRPTAELKSMYVTPAWRGRGIARRVLVRLEELARTHGCAATRLDTLARLEAAVALYESAGYRPVPDYNGSPHADRWYERRL
ncbi:MAG TPA: GNAT family N-acetyltransferase [Solirubrobacterales bacterium]|nr:GNAT family N-acetyltransferase [Solirubrobacterales bacterium]